MQRLTLFNNHLLSMERRLNVVERVVMISNLASDVLRAVL